MSRDYHGECEAFIKAMHIEGMAPMSARLILRHADLLQALARADCDGELTPLEEASDQTSRDVIRNVCAATGCEAIFSGDPRGACVKLKVPSGRTDDWAKTGICVPTREH